MCPRQRACHCAQQPPLAPGSSPPYLTARRRRCALAPHCCLDCGPTSSFSTIYALVIPRYTVYHYTNISLHPAPCSQHWGQPSATARTAGQASCTGHLSALGHRFCTPSSTPAVVHSVPKGGCTPAPACAPFRMHSAPVHAAMAAANKLGNQLRPIKVGRTLAPLSASCRGTPAATTLPGAPAGGTHTLQATRG